MGWKGSRHWVSLRGLEIEGAQNPVCPQVALTMPWPLACPRGGPAQGSAPWPFPESMVGWEGHWIWGPKNWI